MARVEGVAPVLDALGASLRTRRALVWAALLAAAAGVCAFVPLLDMLGFEFAFALGLVASFAAADLGAALVRQRAELSVLRAWVVGTLRVWCLLVPPLVIVAANGLRVPPCDFGHGLVFYALLPGLAVPLATAAGLVAQACFSGRRGAAAAWLIVFASIALGIVRFYAAPPIFGYDPFAGFFPGSLYDEDIELGPAFWWARLYQGATAAAALAMLAAMRADSGWRIRMARPRLRLLALAVGLAGVATTLHFRAADCGFHVTAEALAERMAALETEHFVIYYPRGASFTAQMSAIAKEHEFRWHQVQVAFGVTPQRKITSFYFASAAEKMRWMGAENAYIAKPWRHEIYLSHEDFPHGSLRHEIAHVFAGEFGDALFHVSVKWWGWPPARFNVGLIEGAAVAADWPGNGLLTPDAAAKAMLDLGFLPPLSTILAPGFFAFSTARSYTTAGSFCHFLLERYGAASFRALYAAGGTEADFQSIYGRSLAALDAEWRDHLAATVLSDDEREIARERYRRQGIFDRPCPHTVARLQSEAQELLAGGEPDRAIALLRRVCVEDPDEPVQQLALAGALERAGQVAEAERIERGLGADAALSAPLRARALLRLLDLLALQDRRTEAAAIAVTANALPVEESFRRNLALRQLALSDASIAPPLYRYLFARGPRGAEPEPVALLERAHAVIAAAPNHGLGHYLAGRILSARAAFADAAIELAEAARLGLDDARLRRENDRLLVVAAYLTDQLDLARAAADRLTAAEEPLSVRLYGRDWLARIAFSRPGPSPGASMPASE